MPATAPAADTRLLSVDFDSISNPSCHKSADRASATDYTLWKSEAAVLFVSAPRQEVEDWDMQAGIEEISLGGETVCHSLAPIVRDNSVR